MNLGPEFKAYNDYYDAGMREYEQGHYEKAKTLFEAIKNSPNIVECNLGGTIGPALGINTGPGLVGFVVEIGGRKGV